MGKLVLALVLVAFLVVAILLTAGCNSVAVRTQCLPLPAYTEAEGRQLANELDAIDANSMLARTTIDYGRMRDADRACMGATP